MSKPLAWGAVLIILGVAVAAFGWLGRGWSPDQDDEPQIALGVRLYAEHCAACHGTKLEGQPNWKEPLPDGRMPAPPHDASGHTWHHSDGELFTITKKGLAAVVPGYQSAMPAFEGTLSDEEIRAVLAFIKSSWPQNEREYQQARNKSVP